MRNMLVYEPDDLTSVLMLTEPSSVQAVKYIEYDTAFAEEEKKQAKALKVACNLNDAASKLKLKEYKQAEKLCTKVRNFDLRNFCEVQFCAWLCLPHGLPLYPGVGA